MQTFKIYTLGCKVNQYDSQLIREQLRRKGLKELGNGQKANFYIINTCTVTSSADRQSRYLMRVAKRENPLAKVVVTGCYAHSNADDIERIGSADIILNNDDKNRIVEFLFPDGKDNVSAIQEISDFQGRTRAFVKIQDGCNNFCSFCKVPYVRGRSRSRNPVSIINEIKRLSDKGYKEIVLTGICLGDYGRDLEQKIDLTDLIGEIEKIKGVLRIRLSSIEAKDVTDRLIKKMKTSQKLCPHLHIPFQSGDNEILKLMNRKDRRQDYLKLAAKLRKNIKNMAITTDIMIGFPDEDEKRFLNTLDFLKKVLPSRVHIFPFDPRDNTPLVNFKNNIPEQVLKQRFILLKALSDKLGLKFKRRFLNRQLQVLFEEKKNGFWRGYSQNYLLTEAKNNVNLNNKLMKVNINKIKNSILAARLTK
ncbi:MAG: tRNA (N(6)-L-threonylcarbamoyladenosine(37)-C(2))-methylthiotransferase MtaB [Candidatus Omnitrophica bacterium]|nr:tRNA (N(6)-L-threonylcarbamoyladenosine(37)-C(2))-methylthiotransferase MtaB [Candidatus Omnitrophota bacterium]MDD5352623.1 tRNA (N(6)-L-threonylcarbamoyladenosine(37)-C(2))-methylthiotransferase MtaB [Candidatus Omnitrophota bacterium]MDD5550222.1 tRNA (N(6)-L-threonylcarbamoyladenosine(37)-C(2))-methylthiotransferase MtaB [Candidatus Omnitrophota bacterium]